jgi:hypothetical protein
MKYLGLAMAVIYIGAGVALLIKAGDSLRIPTQYTIPLGIVLIAYGAYRGYNSFKNYHE